MITFCKVNTPLIVYIYIIAELRGEVKLSLHAVIMIHCPLDCELVSINEIDGNCTHVSNTNSFIISEGKVLTSPEI